MSFGLYKVVYELNTAKFVDLKFHAFLADHVIPEIFLLCFNSVYNLVRHLNFKVKGGFSKWL